MSEVLSLRFRSLKSRFLRLCGLHWASVLEAQGVSQKSGKRSLGAPIPQPCNYSALRTQPKEHEQKTVESSM